MNTWMKTLLSVVMLSAAMAAEAASAGSAPAAKDDPHHPQTAPSRKVAPEVNAQLQRMRQMHDRMIAAKTPAERRALMAEYRQVMGEGMTMMQRRYGKPAAGGKAGGMMDGGMMDMMGMIMTMMQDGGCMHDGDETSTTPEQQQ